MFTTADMIAFLRKTMNLPDPDIGLADDDRLSMTDEEMLLSINIVLTKDFADYTCLEEVPTHAIYPIKLLAQKELCLALAVRYAEDYDMVADSNNQIKEGQKFTHYLALAEHYDKLYNKYVTDGGAEGHVLNSYDVLLSGHHYFTPRNYDKGVPPIISVKVKGIYSDSIEVTWEIKGLKRLLNYKVFVSKDPIMDIYKGIIANRARLITTIGDIHRKYAKITGLVPDMEYHVLVIATEQNGLRGMSEVLVTTTGGV